MASHAARSSSQVSRRRRDDAHVAGHRLHDHGRRALQRRPGRRAVVVGHEPGRGRRADGHAGARRHAERRRPASRFRQQAVDGAVVSADGLDDHLAPGRRPRQAQGAGDGLAPGRGHAQLLDGGHRLGDALGEPHLGLGGRAEGRAVGQGRRHGLEDLGRRVAEDRRPPRAEIVDVLVAVDVPQPRPAGAGDEDRVPADRAHRPHRRVDPADEHAPGPLVDGGAPGAVAAHAGLVQRGSGAPASASSSHWSYSGVK